MNQFLFALFALFALSATPFLANAQQEYKQHLKLSYAEIDSLMYIEYKNGAFDKAIPLMMAGREKAEIDFGQQDSTFAEYTSNLGFFYYQTAQYGKALPLYIQAKDIREKTLGKDHPYLASSIINLAGLHQSMGNFDKALPLFIQAKDINEKALGKDHPEFARSLNNLAGLYYNMGNFDRALPLYIQAKDIREKTLGKNHPEFANSLSNLAGLHQSMGNFDRALPLFIQAKDINEKALGKDHPEFANSLGSIAALHKSMGNFDKALPLLIQAKDINEKTLGKDHPYLASDLNNLAMLHYKMGNFDKALPLYIQAKNINEKALGKDHSDFALSLHNLAVLQQSMGNFDKALPLYIQAIEIRKKNNQTNHEHYFNYLNNLARLHQKMGNYAKAWKVLGQAINICSGISLKTNFDIAWSDSLLQASYPSNMHLKKIVNSLTIAYHLLKQDSSIQNSTAKQMVVADLATALFTKLRKQVTNQKDKLRMLAQSNDWLQRSLKILRPKQHTHKAFNLSDQNKSVLLLQATKSQTVYRLGDLPDSLIFQDKKLIKKQSQLQAKLVEKRPDREKDSLRNELNHVNQDIGDFLKMIEQKFPKYHKLKYAQVDAQVEDIQTLLEDNTALLEYVIGDSMVHIFCVTKTQVLWKKSLVDNKKLKYRIKSLHHALSNYKLVSENKKLSYKKFTQQAHWFYQNIVHPVLIMVQGIDNLIIVPDGELGHLPFETFLVEKATEQSTDYHHLHYLVNDYNISYNYSATLWKENKEAPAPKNNGKILAMAANYNIKLDSSMMKVRLPTDQWMREVLKPLPAARKEVEALQGKYQGFFAFDTLASEKMVKNKASDFAILHFAMHGILDSKRPILSSLAFSEDNDNIESNFWQAHEISKMELNANLVVLSACETGYGKFEKGNGIASLARAFMYAGASSLIVSLWQVNDYATSEIMKNLYANLASGLNKDEALRQAKIQYMKSAKGILAHPAFWSPFIMMGKTDPVSIKTKGGAMPWFIGGLAAILVLGAGFVMIRRKKEVT